MTVIPFHDHPKARHGAQSGPATSIAVSGSFAAPSGCVGSFAGTFRLERLLTDLGQLAAAGVFAGALADADGTLLGTGSRRHTAAVVLVDHSRTAVAEIGPVEVNLLGFPVSVSAFALRLPRDVMALVETEPRRPEPAAPLPHQAAAMPPTTSELLGDVVSSLSRFARHNNRPR